MDDGGASALMPIPYDEVPTCETAKYISVIAVLGVLVLMLAGYSIFITYYYGRTKAVVKQLRLHYLGEMLHLCIRPIGNNYTSKEKGF